jgi:hypothetical protein
LRRTRINPELKKLIAQKKLEQRAESIGATIELGKRRAKFNQVKTTYNGQRYDSLGEAEFAQKLDMRLAGGTIRAWSRPAAIVLVNAPTLRGRITYKPDFRVKELDGSVRFYDYKGSHITMTQAWRLKTKLWNVTQSDPLYVAFPSGETQLVASGVERTNMTG